MTVGRLIGSRSVLLALALALSAAGCRDRADDGRRAAAPLPDVLLITVDTLRADHLGVYGSSAARTPVIDSLAAEGTTFDSATSPLPETRPTHFTLFTSLYPRDHGVVSNLGFPRPDLVTLPALYRDAGYRTAAFVGCALFDERARQTFGFELLDAPTNPQRSADAVVPGAVSWLAALEEDQPFFLWLHLFDPHMPYEPPREHDPEPDSPLAATWPDFTWPKLLEAAEANDGDLPRPVLERARALYRGEVEHVDHWLGRLFDALRAEGRWRDTLVALTADHGECFSDGVFFDHSQCLGEGALAVPLILRFPGRVDQSHRVARQVELLDVAPTLLRLSGLERPSELRGSDLLLPADRGSGAEAFAYFERPHYLARDLSNRNEVLTRLRSVAGVPTRLIDPDHGALGVRSGNWKYVVSGAEERLFDLSEGEGRNLAATERERLARFRRALEAWVREHEPPATPETELDPELRQRLRSLGYF